MATLETQFKDYQSRNPDSTLSFDEWKKEHGENLKRSMEDFFKEINTPEYKEKRIQDNIDYLNKVTMDRQLGFYIGENIVDNYLPTLSTGMIRSRKVIQVSEEDSIENKRLDDEWFNTCTHKSGNSGDKEKWDLYFEHNKMLEKKYLPPVLECVFNLIRIDDMIEFKEGLRSSLWNCDMCCYNIDVENIKIENDMQHGFTHITFKLNEE
jgi:hypothetical protein